MTEHANDNQLFLMLGRLEGKVDQVLNKQDDHGKRLDALDLRITTLESDKTSRTATKTTAMSIAHAVWAVLGAGGVYIIHWLQGKL